MLTDDVDEHDDNFAVSLNSMERFNFGKIYAELGQLMASMSFESAWLYRELMVKDFVARV